MSAGAVLVIGATGTTGSRTVGALNRAGACVKAAGRRAHPAVGGEAVRFDWHDPDTHAAVFDEVDRMYLIPPIGDPDPAAVVVPFLEQARAAGVRRVALLSSSAIPSGGPAAGVIHQALPGLFEEWAVLRPSWFMQNFTGDHVHARSIRDEGVVRTATEDGRVGFVDAGDIAAVAARVLTDDDAPNADLILTGPESLSYDDVASLVGHVSGRPIAHRRLSYDQLRNRLEAEVPAEFAAILGRMDRAIAGGAEDRVTDAVEKVTGRPARSLRAVLEAELTTR
ncbi:ergot alkaloid biosynthesis protein [Saccharomonospora sp. CUA-673]|uniref:ergot alkaloid biosynthesis protein n=1 Tax=Saccharomonospora sp. CUA-673 TaxID=1904969 RepID=UPI00095BBB2A|nr:ergot alkaloid biosynthesis protein [Saccharomonospora sp. CUA-673]OLT45437.1 ergot alkaloid biosynthesis protein [Saccharomonospora sp. CUA-673]